MKRPKSISLEQGQGNPEVISEETDSQNNDNISRGESQQETENQRASSAGGRQISSSCSSSDPEVKQFN